MLRAHGDFPGRWLRVARAKVPRAVSAIFDSERVRASPISAWPVESDPGGLEILPSFMEAL